MPRSVSESAGCWPVLLNADFQRRLVLFAEDVNDANHYDLPGWPRFREMVGSDRAARRLFVDMQRSEMGLMELSEIGPSEAAAHTSRIEFTRPDSPFIRRGPLPSLARSR